MAEIEKAGRLECRGAQVGANPLFVVWRYRFDGIDEDGERPVDQQVGFQGKIRSSGLALHGATAPGELVSERDLIVHLAAPRAQGIVYCTNDLGKPCFKLAAHGLVGLV